MQNWGLKALAPNVVQCAHDVKRQLNEKVQHQAEQHQHQKQWDFQDVKRELRVQHRYRLTQWV